MSDLTIHVDLGEFTNALNKFSGALLQLAGKEKVAKHQETEPKTQEKTEKVKPETEEKPKTEIEQINKTLAQKYLVSKIRVPGNRAKVKSMMAEFNNAKSFPEIVSQGDDVLAAFYARVKEEL